MTFFAIFYPVGDLILVASVISTLLSQSASKRAVVASIGIFIFALSDFLYLWLHVNNKYIFGSLSDDGWLVGLALLVMSTQFKASEQSSSDGVNPVFVALSVFLSATLLGMITLRPGYFPSFILIPTLLTLLVAFIRMTIALRQARSLGAERTLARTDELTGLSNRRKLIAEMAEIGDSEGALLIMDLDGFKPINDQYGHAIGDEVLKAAARNIVGCTRSSDIVARIGGDEFIVASQSTTSVSDAVAVSQRIHAAFAKPMHLNGHDLPIGISVGIAKYPEDGVTVDALLVHADHAMYTEKQSKRGGNTQLAGDKV